MATYTQDIDFIASMKFDKNSMDALERHFGAAFTQSFEKAAKIGATKFGEKFSKDTAKLVGEIETAVAGLLQLQQDEEAARAAGNTAQEALLKKQVHQAKIDLRNKKRTLDLEKRAHDHFVDRQEEMLKAYDDVRLKIKVDKTALAKDMGEALSGAFSKVASGDLGGLFGSVGGGLSKGGKMMESAGLAAGGAEGGALAGLATTLGPIVAGLGATVGALGAVAAVFQMAYDQTKKYNQALTEGAAAGDFFASGTGDMAASLGDLRDATFDLGMRYRMDTEEIAKFTNALNTSGVTYKEFGSLARKGATDQRAFFDVTKTAIIAAKGLGIEAGDAAAFMDKSMRDLGKTTLVEIQGAFGMIGDAAARSGMNVKSFFTAINEATSGMALHNIRLEDTIGLMVTMTKVLGEDLAKERVKLEGQFKNMGYQDRLKTIKTTGVGTTSKIVGADARAQAAEISAALVEVIKSSSGDALVTNDKVDATKLGKMNEETFAKIVTKMRAEGGEKGAAAARQLENLVQLARGGARPGDLLAQADAVGQLSKSGELAMQLAGASEVLGKKGIASMQGLTRAAYESITNFSGETFDIQQRLDRELRGQYATAQEKVRAGTATDEEKKFAAMDYTEAIAAGLGREQVEEGVRSGFSTMETMTEQLLKETQSFTTTLKNGVAWTLEKIYKLVEVIANFIGGDDRAELLKKQEANFAAIDKVVEAQQANAEEIDTLRSRKAAFRLDAADEEKLRLAEEKAKKLELKRAGLEGKQGALDRYGTVAGATAMAPVASAAAKVGAGGGAAALAEEKKARIGALNTLASDFSSIATSMVLGGSPVNMFSAYELLTKAPEMLDISQGLGRGGEATGIDQLIASSGLSAEANDASKATLESMLAADKQYFDASGRVDTEQARLLDKLLKEMEKTNKTDALKTLEGVSDAGAAAVSEYLKTGKKEALNIDEFTQATSPSVLQALQNLGITKEPKVNDFIYRGGAGGGVITPIDTADQLLGMKAGGAVSRAGGAGRGSGTVIININGDTATIMRVVKDVLQKSGLAASPNNGFA